MRTLTGLSVLTLVLAGCYIGVGINHAGPAYDEAGKINKIAVLPATMPSKIEGAISPAESERLRSDLPGDAAEWVSSGVMDETDLAVYAYRADAKPATGYYMTLAITYLDVGDNKAESETPSKTIAKAGIYNAASGELVAELTLEKSSGQLGDPPHEQDIKAMASDIGKWFKEKRE